MAFATEKIVPFETGSGTKIKIVPLVLGDTTLPAEAVILVTTAAAKNATTVAVKITTQEASQLIKIPSGTTLPFLDPVTGATKIATLSADFSATTDGTTPFEATGSMTLEANHEAIAVDSTSSNYIVLDGRTTGSIKIKINDERLVTFNSEFFTQGQSLNADGEISCDGAYSSVSAGLLTIESLVLGRYSFDGTTKLADPAHNFWVIISLKSPAPEFSAGKEYKAICYSTDLSVTVEAGKINKQSLPFKTNGKIYITPAIVA